MFRKRFGAIAFENLKLSLAKIRKLPVWIETDLSLQKKHKKNECFSLYIIQSLSWSAHVLLLRVLKRRIHVNGQQLTRYLEKLSLVQWTFSSPFQLESLHLSLFLFMAAIFQRLNKWSCIKYLIKIKISAHRHFIFYRFKDLLVSNIQPWNSIIDRMFVTTRVKIVTIISAILSS